MGNNEGTSKRKTEKGCQQSEMISSNAIHQVLKLDAVTQMYDSMQNLSSPQISQTVDHSTGKVFYFLMNEKWKKLQLNLHLIFIAAFRVYRNSAHSEKC